MDRVSVDDLDHRMGPASEKHDVAGGLDAAGFALNRYVLEPGDSFAFGYHAHSDQEEVFYVLEGTATFETEDGEVAVGPDEAVRFAPGEYQRGSNEGEDRVVALAFGTPAEMGETEILRDCPSCGERTPQRVAMTDDRDALVTRCERCDAETGRYR